jgi:hypothetical protein
VKAISILTAILLLSGAAVAQSDKDKAPGGNVPVAQGPCSKGFDNSVKDGRMGGLSADTMKSVDTNNDGMISKTEFDAACANRLFKEQDSKG